MFCMKCRQINLSRKSVCAQVRVNSLLVGCYEKLLRDPNIRVYANLV